MCKRHKKSRKQKYRLVFWFCLFIINNQRQTRYDGRHISDFRRTILVFLTITWAARLCLDRPNLNRRLQQVQFPNSNVDRERYDNRTATCNGHFSLARAAGLEFQQYQHDYQDDLRSRFEFGNSPIMQVRTTYCRHRVLLYSLVRKLAPKIV